MKENIAKYSKLIGFIFGEVELKDGNVIKSTIDESFTLQVKNRYSDRDDAFFYELLITKKNIAIGDIEMVNIHGSDDLKIIAVRETKEMRELLNKYWNIL